MTWSLELEELEVNRSEHEESVMSRLLVRGGLEWEEPKVNRLKGHSSMLWCQEDRMPLLWL